MFKRSGIGETQFAFCQALSPHNLKTCVYCKGHLMRMLSIYLPLNHQNIVMRDLFDVLMSIIWGFKNLAFSIKSRKLYFSKNTVPSTEKRFEGLFRILILKVLRGSEPAQSRLTSLSPVNQSVAGSPRRGRLCDPSVSNGDKALSVWRLQHIFLSQYSRCMFHV